MTSISSELRRHPRLLAACAAVSALVGVLLVMHFASDQQKVGIGSTRMLVNTPSSIVADLNPSGSSTLATRAQLLGNVLASEEVRTGIAKTAHLAPDQLVVTPLSVGGTVQTPLAAAAPKPVGGATLSVDADPLLPIIAVTVHAPTPALAGALANGAVTVLQSYIKSIAQAQGIPSRRQPVITSLGAASVATQTTGIPPIVGVLGGLVVFGLGCYVILLVDGTRRRRREATATEPHDEAAWSVRRPSARAAEPSA